jgi:sugar-specific transcriptional regulator TrmB
MYEKELQTLGLSEKEAKVYLTSLELGADTAQNIAQRSGINRATTYVQIELLKQKGLMSQFEKGKKTFYTAESPERLASLLSSFEKEINFKKSELTRILPSLQDLFAGAGERPKVRFFEGAEGSKALHAEYLMVKNKKIEAFVNLDQLLKFAPKHEEDYTPHRISKNIHGYIIYTQKSGVWTEGTDEKKLREARYLPPADTEDEICADIDIFDNKVAIITYRSKPTCVIIEDSDIAKTLRTVFRALWKKL